MASDNDLINAIEGILAECESGGETLTVRPVSSPTPGRRWQADFYGRRYERGEACDTPRAALASLAEAMAKAKTER